ncbi:MAG: signal peptidase I [Bacteroidales bacterium]|nr:signal peptidase I [Bacteroidales bacterium]
MSIYMFLTLLFLVAGLAGLWNIFVKAGHHGWKALVPFYNFYIWLKIIDKPAWWYLFLIIPFINVFTFLLMVVETLKCFRKDGLLEQALGVLLPFAALPYLGFSPKETYTHPSKLPKIKKSAAREWADAIIFAVIAATFIRTFLLEAYTIPTSSMEKSLLVGDYLFVSKIAYGPKIPRTPIAFPFAHHTLPLTENTKSYLEWIRLPHYRYPGIRSVRNNDLVVFNYPDGDTVALQLQNQSYYDLIRVYGRDAIWRNYDVIARPVDKRENYIKRCLAIPGDVFEMRDGVVYINGEVQSDPPETQHNYRVVTDGTPLSQRVLNRLNITDWGQTGRNVYQLAMTEHAAREVEKVSSIIQVEKILRKAGQGEQHIFPHHPSYPWNEDNFGPLHIPAKGQTVEINAENIVLYDRIISVYEGNELKVDGDRIYINGRETRQYTFEMDYFWMVGDNRHNSADSRFWGFVPEDHIVGRAMFVWLSLDKERRFPGNIRFNKSMRIIR